MDLIEYRRERRRTFSAAYSREYRAQKAKSRAPDSRAVGAALLALLLDAYADRGSTGAPTELLDRLAFHGYDRHAAQDAVEAMVSRHAAMLTLSRAAIDAGAWKSA